MFTFPDISFHTTTDSHVKIFNFWFPFWYRFLADLKASWTSVYPPTLFYANHILSHTHVSIFVSIEVYLHRLYVSLLMNRMFSSHGGNQWMFFYSFHFDVTVIALFSFYLHGCRIILFKRAVCYVCCELYLIIWIVNVTPVFMNDWD